MKTMTYVSLIMVGLLLGLASVSQAATLDWDGGGGDGLLSTANNWDPNQAPASSDTLNIGTGDTVSHENNLPGSVTINLTGSSTLSPVTTVLRLNGASINVGSGSSLTGGGFGFDFDNGDLTFNDGAIFGNTSWEQKGANTFTFNLSASGFTAMTPGTFRCSGGSANIANATYTADMAAYAGGSQVITLVDFTSDAVSMDNSIFQGAGGFTVNNTGSHTARFFWDDAAEAIKLNIDPTVTWDAGGSDGIWSTAANWTGEPDNQAPVVNDTVEISNGDTVEWNQNGNLPDGLTINLSNNSTLKSSNVLRLNGATIAVPSGCTLTSGAGNFFDLYNATLSFEDGATNTVALWEHKGTNTFNYTLSAAGFTPLTPTTLMAADNPATDWSDATFNIDISDYNIANGTTVTLLDATNHDTDFNGTFNPTVNLIRGASRLDATLSFDTDTSALILTLTDEIIWEGGAGDGLWKTASNWNIDAVPAANDTVVISNGDTVSYDTSTGESLPGSLTVNLSGNSTLTASGGAIRLNNATITVDSGSTLTSTGGTHWDLDDADITFEAGAICTIDDWENKDVNTFSFNLGAAGFTALAPNRFLIGGGGTHNPGNIANATYTVDMAAYTGGTGTITLVTFANDSASMDNTAFQTATLNVLNRGDFTGSYLSWNDTEESIVLNVTYPTWDGEAGDGLWTNAVNWSGDVAPVAGDTVVIANGDTVEWNETAGSGNLPGSLTVNLSGNSTLTASVVIRLNNATINVASGSGLTSIGGSHWDLDDADFTFEDGAICTVDDWEQRDANTINFTLSETGFTALTPNTLRSGSSAAWSDVTYNIDMSAYNVSNGKTIVLMDFGSHVAAYNDTFNPTVNVTGAGGTLSFDTDESRLIFTTDADMGTLFRFK